jgi:hypothetical protein
MSTASRRYAEAAGGGALAGTLAATVQVAVGWLLDRWLLPRGHDNNIAPRLVNRTLRRTRHRTNAVREWVLGTLFHYGYGLGWGALFGILRRRSRLPNPVLGGLLGSAIYALAFSEVGVGTATGTERHPRRRPWQKQVSLVTVALTYAFSLAAFFARFERRGRRGEPPKA